MSRTRRTPTAALPDGSPAGYFASRLAACMLVMAMASAHDGVKSDCYVGSYRLADDTVVDIEPEDGATLDWLRLDGTLGTLHRTAGGVWKSTAGMTGREDGMSVTFPDCKAGSIIKSLMDSGLPFTLAYYPHAEHGLTLFETHADGTRVTTRYAPGYFAMIRDFALLGRLPGAYGDAEITRPRASPEPAASHPAGSDATTGAARGEGMTATPRSQGVYRLPFADGTQVQVFDDFTTHRPRGRIDIYAISGKKPYRVVAAAAGRIVALQDGYSEQQSGRAAALCHNNYVWIAHPNGEWTNYSHVAHDSVTGKAHLKVGDSVAAGQYIGDEGAVGCAMLHHVHFEVAVPDPAHPIDSGGFLTGNDAGRRELNPRFCGVPGQNAVKGRTYLAGPCG